MRFPHLKDIDDELNTLGAVPDGLSEIVASYGVHGQRPEEVDEILVGLAAGVKLGDVAVVPGEALPAATSSDIPQGPSGGREVGAASDEALGAPAEDYAPAVADLPERLPEPEGLLGFEQSEVPLAEGPPPVSSLAEPLADPKDSEAQRGDVRAAGEKQELAQAEPLAADMDAEAPELVPSSDMEEMEVGDWEIQALEGAEQLVLEADDGDDSAWEPEVGARSDPPEGEGVREPGKGLDEHYKQLLEQELDPDEFPRTEPPSWPGIQDAPEQEEVIEIGDDELEPD